ncbi:hypothetical protein K2Z84_31185, partial [Candidatus Binatia bacterium]|nr:hypothetical protein [Candidatus Binatia bacterium]
FAAAGSRLAAPRADSGAPAESKPRDAVHSLDGHRPSVATSGADAAHRQPERLRHCETRSQVDASVALGKNGSGPASE